jgi:asparagine synthase (glutamine-hydrolysing)
MGIVCGIAGTVSGTSEASLEPVIRAMTSALWRRGPDSEGSATWPGVALGHRRLAILDLSQAGHQPMLSSDGQVGLVFNGCIYNFLELRKELEQLGCRFRSRSDTEVLLHGYRAWGIDRLTRRLRGMFAFGVWDNGERRLILVRDRLGVKPLFYTCTADGGVAFASTARALEAAGLVGEVDAQAVLEFLEFGYVTDERSIFHGVHKLPAASILEWRDGKTDVRSYWSMPEAGATGRMRFEEAVEKTEALLLDAVRVRLQADVPIGVLLSGGIDSTLICWALSKLNANLKAFTVSTPGDPSDESTAASRTAAQLGLTHEIVALPEDQGDLLDQLTEAYSEPFGCSSALAMLRVSAAVKPFATVLLTGDGGDDVFLGYPYHRNYWAAQRLARVLPGWMPSLWRAARPWAGGLAVLRRGKHFLDYATGGLGAVTRVHDGLPYFEQRGILGERLAGLGLSQRAIPLSQDSARRLLFDMLAYERRMQFVGEFMTKVDGGTMHYAIEARSPLLDHVLWEFAAGLPPEVRLRGGELKAILREIVRRRVGADVARRRKRGFTIPVERWLAARWSQTLERLAAGPLLERDGWVRPGSLEAPIGEALDRQWAPAQLWYLVVLENWLRKRRGR